MNKKLLKTLIILLIIFGAATVSAQENLDLTINDNVVSSKYSPSKGTLSAVNGEGITLTTDGTANFFELRVNNLSTNGQNKVTINYTSNTTGVDGLILKQSANNLVSTNIALTSTQAIEFCDDANFKDAAGDIQLRFRFTASTGNIATGKTITFTSIIIESDATANNKTIFEEANTYVTTENSNIFVKNAPKGSHIQVYNIFGQTVSNKNLNSGTYIVKISAQGTTLSKQVILF